MNKIEALGLLQGAGIKTGIVTAAGEIQCVCPFHKDDRPSLFVNYLTGKYICFAGCVKGRSVEDLVFRASGKVIEDATSNLSIVIKNKLNLPAEEKDYRVPSIPVLPYALDNRGGNYLIKRGFNVDTIESWGLQYWEDQDGVVIPFEAVGYIMRFIDPIDKSKKYKYITGTRITDSLFGIHKINLVLGFVILVEGSLDAIWLHQLGFHNALAILHSDISEKQTNQLKALGNKYPIYLMLDNDDGGDRAAISVKNKLCNYFMVRTCRLPEGKDPNNCTKEEIENSIKGAKNGC